MTDASRDTRQFEICAPWYGEKGAAFERKFEPEFDTLTKVDTLEDFIRFRNFSMNIAARCWPTLSKLLAGE